MQSCALDHQSESFPPLCSDQVGPSVYQKILSVFMHLYFYTMFLTSFKIEGNVVWENGGIWNGATASQGISGKAQESMETKVKFVFIFVEKILFLMM